MPTSYAHWKSLPELQEDFQIPVVIVPHNSSDSFLSKHKKVNSQQIIQDSIWILVKEIDFLLRLRVLKARQTNLTDDRSCRGPEKLSTFPKG